MKAPIQSPRHNGDTVYFRHKRWGINIYKQNTKRTIVKIGKEDDRWLVKVKGDNDWWHFSYWTLNPTKVKVAA